MVILSVEIGGAGTLLEIRVLAWVGVVGDVTFKLDWEVDDDLPRGTVTLVRGDVSEGRRSRGLVGEVALNLKPDRKLGAIHETAAAETRR